MAGTARPKSTLKLVTTAKPTADQAPQTFKHQLPNQDSSFDTLSTNSAKIPSSSSSDSSCLCDKISDLAHDLNSDQIFIRSHQNKQDQILNKDLPPVPLQDLNFQPYTQQSSIALNNHHQYAPARKLQSNFNSISTNRTTTPHSTGILLLHPPRSTSLSPLISKMNSNNGVAGKNLRDSLDSPLSTSSTKTNPFEYQTEATPRVMKLASSSKPHNMIDVVRANRYYNMEQEEVRNNNSNRDSAIAVTPALQQHQYEPPHIDNANSYTYHNEASLSHPEQKRIRSKFRAIKEFVSTEEIFAHDLQLVVDIYIQKLRTEPFFGYVCQRDVALLTSNVDQILSLSRYFVDCLRRSIPKYVLDNEFTGEPLIDVKTGLGSAVLDYIPKMERQYKFYCDKNRQQTATYNRIKVLASPVVDLWLTECYELCQHLTPAATLDALIIKPVQRLLKYPLLLERVLKATPQDHVDHESLKQALEEMQNCTVRINANHPGEDNSQNHHISVEGANNILLQLRYEHTADFILESLLKDFHQKKFQMAELVKAIRKNTVQIQQMFDSNNRLAKSWLSWIMTSQDHSSAFSSPASSASSTSSAQQDFKSAAKNRRYKHYALFTGPFTSQSNHQLSTDRLKERIESEVLREIESAIKMYESTQKLISIRITYHASYSKYTNSRHHSMPTNISGSSSYSSNGHDMLDSQTKNEADQFVKYHNSLKDGLPDLFLLTEEMVEAAMRKLVTIQREWFREAADSLATVFNIKVDDIKDPTDSSKDPIIEKFKRSSVPKHQSVEDLAICAPTLASDDSSDVAISSEPTRGASIESEESSDNYSSSSVGFKLKRTKSGKKVNRKSSFMTLSTRFKQTRLRQEDTSSVSSGVTS